MRMIPANRFPAHNSGFTLVELLIVLVITGILASLAMPSFKSMMLNQRIKTATEELYSSISFARSEAITRDLSDTIIIVPVSTTDWGQGWSIKAGASTLKTFQAKSNIQITGPAGAAVGTLTYGQNGRLTVAGAQIFYITNTGSAASTVIPRCVIISTSGQPIVRADSNKDGDCTNG